MRQKILEIHNAVTDERTIVECVNLRLEIKVESQNGVDYPLLTQNGPAYGINGISDETKCDVVQLAQLLDTRMMPKCSNGHESNVLHRILDKRLLCDECLDYYDADGLWAFDQYGDPVPRNLVALPPTDVYQFDTLTLINRIIQADWWSINGMIFVEYWVLDSTALWNDLELTVFDDICYDVTEVNCIADSLKRFSREDGFYHA